MQTAFDLIFMVVGIGLILVHVTGLAEVGIIGLISGGACIVFGLFRLQRLWQHKQALASELLQDKSVIDFYEATMDAWHEGRLAKMSKEYKQEAALSYDAFVDKYPPIVGSAMHIFFTQFPPRPDEFLIGIGNSDARNNSGWFILTNRRVIQRDGRDGNFREIDAKDIVRYETSGTWTKTLRFTLRSGQVEEFAKVDIYPTENFIAEVQRQAAEDE